MNKYFLYARKSTDVEDKQVLSIEAQLTELRAYARQEKLEIIEELVEKQSAKIPGRTIFNEMLSRIENGEANGIISWNPDRLARNSVDGGKVIYLLDTGKIASLKFPTFWCDNTSQGKFMLNIAFGQSKYYVDSLSDNTKRGLRQKVRRGEYPSLAPIGYLNDPRNKSVVMDKKKSIAIQKIFDIYALGNSTLGDISHFLAQKEILTRGSKPLTKDRVSCILSNPFYIGLFRFTGEIYEGKHQPIISKKIFDKVQEILRQRGRPRRNDKIQPQPYCGLLKCPCGMMITAENKFKKQLNGNVHHYVYYRCSRKSKTIKCKETPIRQELLDKHISSLLQKFSLRSAWAEGLRKLLQEDEKESTQSSAAFVQEKIVQIKTINIKLQRLLDSYLEQDIDREIYLSKKSELISEKKTLEEQITNLEQKHIGWIEPMRNWINKAENLEKIAQDSNLFLKKVAAKEIFGLNLLLANREARLREPSGADDSDFSLSTEWAAVSAAHNQVNDFSESCLIEPLVGIEPTTYSFICTPSYLRD